jgi:hypothetical protein
MGASAAVVRRGVAGSGTRGRRMTGTETREAGTARWGPDTVMGGGI